MRSAILSLALMPFALGGLLSPVSAASPEELDRLWQALEMPGVIEVMRVEGLQYGATLDEDMLEGLGGARFSAAVERIYDPEAMQSGTRAAFDAALAPRDISAALGFFEGETGSRATAMELEARRAMLEPEVDRAARQAALDLRKNDQPRLDLLRRFAEANDLIEANVSGALNANYAFLGGMASIGALGPEMDEAAILEEVWSQEPVVREDTESWVMGFLTLSYQGLSLDELGSYADFSASPEGRELNRALFTAFDAMFNEISFRLGAAVAEELIGEDL